jgi:hypothetical protein
MRVPDRSPPAPTFLIGQDSQGRWVVQDRRGLCGGLFVNREEAIRYAMFESGLEPQAALMVPGVLELDLGASSDIRDIQTTRHAA